MSNTELITRVEALLAAFVVDTDDIKSVMKFEKLVKLHLALQRAQKKDPVAEVPTELEI